MPLPGQEPTIKPGPLPDFLRDFFPSAHLNIFPTSPRHIPLFPSGPLALWPSPPLSLRQHRSLRWSRLGLTFNNILYMICQYQSPLHLSLCQEVQAQEPWRECHRKYLVASLEHKLTALARSK